MLNRRGCLALPTLLLGATWAKTNVRAQAGFPSKPVRIVMGMPTGGLADTLARALSRELSLDWGQSIIIENRPGASGIVAALAASKAAPDGYMIVLVNDTQFVSAALLQKPRPYDPLADLVPVVGLANINNVLAASPKLGVASVRELIDLARKEPGKLHYGTLGIGSAAHLAAESFFAIAGFKATGVDYRGGPEALKAVVQDEIDFAFTGLAPALPLIADKQLVALAYDGVRRYPALPDVPTLKEQGFNIVGGGWFGLLAPVNIPESILARFQKDVHNILEQEGFQKRWIEPAGMEPMNATAEDLARLLRDDVAVLEPLIAKLGLSVK